MLTVYKMAEVRGVMQQYGMVEDVATYAVAVKTLGQAGASDMIPPLMDEMECAFSFLACILAVESIIRAVTLFSSLSCCNSGVRQVARNSPELIRSLARARDLSA
jgi:hypothetical protein